MLQNRVDPLGNIIQTTARGAWLGNRGQLHGRGKTILRPFKHQAWIICLLEFKGRRRDVMAPNLWTELFFLDEATAFAAGHRPCFECRRDAANRFKAAWLTGNPEYGFAGNAPIGESRMPIGKIDGILQSERIDQNRNKVTFEADSINLPDGTFIQVEDQPYLVAGNRMYHWTPFGYDKNLPLLSSARTIVLTPRSTVNAFRAGYLPQISAA